MNGGRREHVLGQVHSLEQGVVARVGSVGVEELVVLGKRKMPISLLIGPVERCKHRIHFAGGRIIVRSSNSVNVRVGELPHPFLAKLVIAGLMVGRGQ